MVNSNTVANYTILKFVYDESRDDRIMKSQPEMQRVNVLSSPSRVRDLHVSSRVRVRVLLGRTRVRIRGQQISSPSPSPGIYWWLESESESQLEQKYPSSSISVAFPQHHKQYYKTFASGESWHIIVHSK